MLGISEIILTVASKAWCCSVGTSVIRADSEGSALCSSRGLVALAESWRDWLSSASHFLISGHSEISLWKSWRNIPIYKPTLYFCDKAERIKSPCCIFFPHLGTRALTAEVGFVFPTHVAAPSSCTLLFIRVLEGCLASCPHFPQTNGKPGGKCWDMNRSVSKALPSAA